MSEATKRPWVVVIEDIEPWQETNDVSVANMSGSIPLADAFVADVLGEESTRRANAELITRAVNSHDALVKCAQQVTAYFGSGNHLQNCRAHYSEFCTCSRILDELAHAALDAVKGE